MKNLISILFYLVANSIFAQSTIYQPSTAARVAYMGSIIHPGFKVGIERPYKIFEVKKRSKTIFKERGFAFNLGLYHHKTYHTNSFLQTEWLLRRQKTSGLFFDFSVGAGVSKTFLDGATYEIDTDSKAQKVKGAGDTYVLTSIAWSVGYNMDLKKKDKLRFYLKPSLMAFFPYNNFFYVRPTAELGLIYNLNNFWKTSPKLFKK